MYYQINQWISIVMRTIFKGETTENKHSNWGKQSLVREQDAGGMLFQSVSLEEGGG